MFDKSVTSESALLERAASYFPTSDLDKDANMVLGELTGLRRGELFKLSRHEDQNKFTLVERTVQSIIDGREFWSADGEADPYMKRIFENCIWFLKHLPAALASSAASGAPLPVTRGRDALEKICTDAQTKIAAKAVTADDIKQLVMYSYAAPEQMHARIRAIVTKVRALQESQNHGFAKSALKRAGVAESASSAKTSKKSKGYSRASSLFANV